MRYTTGKKAFSWSYSKLKNFRTCGYRYLKIDVEKTYQEDMNSEVLRWGDQVHKAFAARVEKGEPFPVGMENFEDAAARLVGLPGVIKVEQQLAIREDLTPCEWFAKDAWFRGIADYLRINGPVALAIDYKTGKILEEAEQLALVAECVFSHYPQVQAVRTEFWWLKDDVATREDFHRNKRAQTWASIKPKVMELQHAHETMAFPQRPSGLCRKHCIVKDCPHNGNK